MTDSEVTVVLSMLNGDPISRLSSTSQISSQDLFIVARPEVHDAFEDLIDTENFLSDIIAEESFSDISDLVTENIMEVMKRVVHLDYKLTYDQLSTQLLNDVSARFAFKSMAYRDSWEYARRLHSHDYSKVRCYPNYSSSDVMSQYPVPPSVNSPHDLDEWIGMTEIWALSTLCVGVDIYGRGVLSDCYVPMSTDIFIPHIELPKYQMPDIGDTRFIVQSNKDIHVEVPLPEHEIKIFQNCCDICFVIDTTESMNSAINTVQTHIIEFFENLEKDVDFQRRISIWRGQIIGYGDSTCDDPWYERYNFQDNSAKLSEQVSKILRTPGGDPQETTFQAIIKTISDSEWQTETESRKVVKIVVVFTDVESKGSNSDAYNKLRDNNVHVAFYAPSSPQYDYFFTQPDSNVVTIQTGIESGQNYATCTDLVRSASNMLDQLKGQIVDIIIENIPDVPDIGTSQGDVPGLGLYYDDQTSGYWAHPYGQTISCLASEFVDACKMYGNNGKTGNDTSFTVPLLSNFIKMNPNVNRSDPMRRVEFQAGVPSHKHDIDKDSIEYDATIIKVLASIKVDTRGSSERSLGNVIHTGEPTSKTGIANITKVSCDYSASEINTRESISDPISYREDQEPYPKHQKIPLMVYIGSR